MGVVQLGVVQLGSVQMGVDRSEPKGEGQLLRLHCELHIKLSLYKSESENIYTKYK